MNLSTRWGRITLTTVMLVFALASGKGLAANWKHQSMAWVFGPDGTSIRSPDPEVSGAQPAGFTWSMVPGNVGAVYFAGGNQITGRITQEFTDLNATGLNSFADYKGLLMKSSIEEFLLESATFGSWLMTVPSYPPMCLPQLPTFPSQGLQWIWLTTGREPSTYVFDPMPISGQVGIS